MRPLIILTLLLLTLPLASAVQHFILIDDDASRRESILANQIRTDLEEELPLNFTIDFIEDVSFTKRLEGITIIVRQNEASVSVGPDASEETIELAQQVIAQLRNEGEPQDEPESVVVEPQEEQTINLEDMEIDEEIAEEVPEEAIPSGTVEEELPEPAAQSTTQESVLQQFLSYLASLFT